jgi:tol-pal system protein YbgF
VKSVLRTYPSILALVAAMGVPSMLPAQSTKDRLLEIQRDVALLQGALMESDRGTGEKIAALEALMKQNLDAITKLNQALAVIESAVNRQGDQVVGPVVNTAAKVDAMSAQFGGLRDAVEESNSMITRLQREVEDIKTTLTTLPPPGSYGAPGGESGASLGDDFFNQAQADFNRGNYDLAKAQFDDFLRLSAGSSRAPEAQYYLGAIAYNQEDYTTAVTQFDLVLERYPVGLISADALFKKAMALQKLGKTAEATKEFQAVVERFPNSSVAPNAQGMLDELAAGGAKPSPVRRR